MNTGMEWREGNEKGGEGEGGESWRGWEMINIHCSMLDNGWHLNR